MKSLHSGRTCLRACLLAVILVALSSVASNTASAADVRLRLRTGVDADELVLSDFSSLSRRRFSQSLWMTGYDDIPKPFRDILLTVHGRWESDVARLLEPRSDDVRFHEVVDFTLLLADARLRLDDHWEISAGRQLWMGVLGVRDADGLVVSRQPHRGLATALRFGQSVRYSQPDFEGAWFDVPDSRRDVFDFSERGTDWLLHGEVGWIEPDWRALVGHGVGLRAGQRESHNTGILASASIEPVQLRLSGLWDHRLARLQSADVVVAALAPTWLRADLSWRVRAPSWDAESLFQIFDQSRSATLRANIAVQPIDSLWVGLAGFQRGLAIEGDMPWLAGVAGDSDAEVRGGELWSQWQPLPLWSFGAQALAQTGFGGTVTSEELSARWEVWLNRADLSLRLRHGYREGERRLDSAGHLLAARGQGAYELGDFGRVLLSVDYLADYRMGQAIRFMLTADLRFGPI